MLQVLFTAEPDSDHSSEAFLRLYSPFLVSVLMLEQQQDELAAIASAMGAKFPHNCAGIRVSQCKS